MSENSSQTVFYRNTEQVIALGNIARILTTDLGVRGSNPLGRARFLRCNRNEQARPRRWVFGGASASWTRAGYGPTRRGYIVPASTSTSTPDVPTLAPALPLPPIVLSSKLTAPDPLSEPPTLSSVVWLVPVPVPEVLRPLDEPVFEVAGALVLVPVPAVAPVSVWPAVPVPLVLPVPVSLPPVPSVPVVAVGVETETAGFTSAEAAESLLSMLAAPVPLPVPLALADVPGPALLAVASPSANASLLDVRPLVSTDPSEPASI